MCESINDQLNLVKLISYLFLILFSNHLSIKFRFLLAISNRPSNKQKIFLYKLSENFCTY